MPWVSLKHLLRLIDQSRLQKKLNSEIDLQMEDIPMEKLPEKVKEIQDKIREASVNTDLDIREFLGIDKALQTIKGELILNTSK